MWAGRERLQALEVGHCWVVALARVLQDATRALGAVLQDATKVLEPQVGALVLQDATTVLELQVRALVLQDAKRALMVLALVVLAVMKP